MYLNKVLLYGNLTRDPEVRALPSGQQVVTFSIATNRTYKDKNGAQQDQTEYHNIVAFGKLAEIMGQYLKKGRPVYVEGRLQTRSWETDGKKNYRTEVVVDQFQFGADGNKGGSGMSGQGSSSQSSPASHGPEEGGMQQPDGGSHDQIQYPDEDINPEDIPF